MATVCEEVLEKASLEGTRDAEVTAHARDCADCREKLRGVELLASTRLEPSDRALVGFAARTRAKLEQQSSGARFLSPLRAAVTAGAVAAAGASGVLLSVDLTPRVTPAGGTVGSAPVAAVRKVTPPATIDDATEELFRLELLADPVDPFESFESDELYAFGLDVYDDELDALFGEEG